MIRCSSLDSHKQTFTSKTSEESEAFRGFVLIGMFKKVIYRPLMWRETFKVSRVFANFETDVCLPKPKELETIQPRCFSKLTRPVMDTLRTLSVT